MDILNQLITDYLPSVYNYAYRLARDQALAEDITQETFIKVWKNIKRYDKDGNPRAWLFRIAHNTAIDYLRRRHAINFSRLGGVDQEFNFAETLADPAPLPDEIFARVELKEELTAALARLAPPERAVVTLRHEADLTFAEIAEVLGEPLNTVKSRYRRALITLRAKLLHQND